MANSSRSSKTASIRVSIGKKELLAWGGKDVPQSIVKHWLELGRQRSETNSAIGAESRNLLKKLDDLRREIDELRDDNRKLILLVSQMAHLLCVSSASDHYDLEVLRFKEETGIKLPPIESNKLNAYRVKGFNFQRYLNRLFPGLESDHFLSLKQE